MMSLFTRVNHTTDLLGQTKNRSEHYLVSKPSRFFAIAQGILIDRIQSITIVQKNVEIEIAPIYKRFYTYMVLGSILIFR